MMSQQAAINKNISQDHQSYQTRRQVPVKMASPLSTENSQVQRKLLTFFYIYAILIISLYVTYAAYYFYHHHQLKKEQQQQQQQEQNHNDLTDATISGLPGAASPLKSAVQQEQHQHQLSQDLEAKLESKIHLLERYIEVIAIDLQETKNKLREREKCDCSLSCTFNGTRYADRSSWQHQCDTCTCQSGRISCVPQKCPPSKCDDAIILPGQCCPTCMKRCKHSNTIIRHGQKFNPLNSTSRIQTKQCKCYDGLIKCEQIQAQKATTKLAGQIGNAIGAAIAINSATSSTKDKQQQSQMTDTSAPLPIVVSVPIRKFGAPEKSVTTETQQRGGSPMEAATEEPIAQKPSEGRENG